MIIHCPSCDAQYILPDDAIGPKGRKVKCTTCAHVWVQKQDLHAADPLFEPEIEDPFKNRRERLGDKAKTFVPPEAIVVPDAPRKDMVLQTFGLCAILLVLTLGCMTAIRFSAVSWWPPIALMYDTLGIPAPAPGKNLALKDVTVTASDTIDVAGKLSNKTKTAQFLPVLRIRLNGENKVLKDWDIDLYGKSLPPRKDAAFQYSLKDAPADGQSVTLFFVD